METAIKPEISRDFNPSLPKARDKVVGSTNAEAQITNPSVPPSFLNRLKTGLSQSIQEATQGRESLLTPEQIQAQTQELYEKSLERVELQVDLRRQARKIIIQRGIPDTELRTESAFIIQTYLQRNIQLTDEQAREMAYGRIVTRGIKELIEGNVAVTHKSVLSPQQIKARLLAGDIAEVNTALASSEDEENLRTFDESKKKLHEVDIRMSQLSKDPRVINEFNVHRSERTEILRKASTVDRIKERAKKMAIRHDRKARQVYLEGRQYSQAENTVLEYEDKVADAIQEAAGEMLADPEVFDAYRIKYLQRLQEGFKRDRFAETPSRQGYLDDIRHLWVHGGRILVTGPTGGGKSELLWHAARSLFGVEAEKLSGHPNMTNYEIYGKQTGKGVGEDNRPIIAFDPAAFTRAIDRDRPLVIDEINVIPNKMLMRMKADLNARPGQSITIQEENGKLHRVGTGFVVGATANVKSEKHPEREELDPAIVRMFRGLKINYFPSEELYDIMLANMMDIRGGVKLTIKDATETLKSLSDATGWTQQAYNGDAIVTNPDTGAQLNARGSAAVGKPALLETAVLDPGTAIDMLIGWEDARRKGLTLREHLNPQILSFIHKEDFPVDDRYYLAEIFALQGFLKGVNVAQLNIPGLDQATLDSWNGYDGKRYIPSKDVKRYLPSDVVAKLDPYGVLRPSMSADIKDLLDEGEKGEIVEEDDVTIKTAATISSSGLPQQRTIRSPLTPSNYRGLSIIPTAEAQDVLQTFDKMYPHLPDSVEDRTEYLNKIFQIMVNSPSAVEVGTIKVGQFVDDFVARSNKIDAEFIFDISASLNGYLAGSKRDLTPEVAGKLKSAYQKMMMISRTGNFSGYSGAITGISNSVYKYLDERINTKPT